MRNRQIHPEVAEHLAATLQQLKRRWRKRWNRVRREPEAERVHQLRVETRRLLAWVNLLRAAGLTDQIPKVRKQLKRELDAFDELRDLHVCRLQLARLDGAESEAEALQTTWAEREARLAKELSRSLSTKRRRRLDASLRKLRKRLERHARVKAQEPPARGAGMILEPLFAEVRKRARRVTTARAVHRLRVAFKHYRYACELLQPLLPGLRSTTLARMRAFHTLMGELQDLIVLGKALRRDARVAKPDGAWLRRTVATLRQRQRQWLVRCGREAARLERWGPSRLAETSVG